MKFESRSLDDTKKLATQLAEKKFKKNNVNHAQVIALSGDLGSGKTTFTQFFAQALGIKEKIISPTFIIMRHHLIPESSKILYHLDLYRIEDPINTKELGLDELLLDINNIILIEWPDKIITNLPNDSTLIKINKKSGSKRIFEINPKEKALTI